MYIQETLKGLRTMSNNTYRRGHDREAGRTRKELEMGKRNRNDVNITLTYEVLKISN